jgi:hypothetical protein
MKKLPRKLVIACTVLLVLLVAGYAGWQVLVTYFVNQYYQDAYAPLELAAGGFIGIIFSFHYF